MIADLTIKSMLVHNEIYLETYSKYLCGNVRLNDRTEQFENSHGFREYGKVGSNRGTPGQSTEVSSPSCCDPRLEIGRMSKYSYNK
ncbi:hypothetical protein CHS0354_036173 [Potamilus streckersoni]|uniref:Uncharacterized protein n=1 Tax=Potamilus streckersoni TaxID=2493646 RepID=A0AAE0S256_9BIVA|nr:hypothetical protein CHS0354_036173 [Potamilus streckersoni]